MGGSFGPVSGEQLLPPVVVSSFHGAISFAAIVFTSATVLSVL
jgi:hypothetical protein